MSAGRTITRVAVALTIVLVAGCAEGASTDTRAQATPAWSTPVDWPFSLAVDGRDAIVTVSRNRIVDLHTADGHKRWHADLPHVTHFTPALDDDTVLVSAADRFVALERNSGARRWEASMGEHAGGVELAHVDGAPIAVVTTERGVVAVLDGDTGVTRWSVPVPGDIYAQPAVDSGAGAGAVVWRGDVERLRVFDLATGAPRWETTVDPGATAPAIHKGLVVLGEGKGNFEARVVGRDLASGAERWSVPVPASFESGLTPGIDGDDVAVSDHFGTVTLVDTREGKARWQTAIREPVLDTKIMLTSRSVALATYDGQIVILDRHSGRIVRRVDPGGFPVGIGVSGRRLLFAVRFARPGRVEALAMP